MDFERKSERNQQIYEQYKLDRKLRRRERREQGERFEYKPKPQLEIDRIIYHPRKKMKTVRDCTRKPGVIYFEEDFDAGIFRRFRFESVEDVSEISMY